MQVLDLKYLVLSEETFRIEQLGELDSLSTEEGSVEDNQVFLGDPTMGGIPLYLHLCNSQK